MRIAVPAKSADGLLAEVEEHFGRARVYVFVDIDDSGEPISVEVAEVNFEGHGPGEIPSWVKSHAADVVIAGGMGHRAIDFFNQLGIEVVTGATGRISDVIRAYVAGKLTHNATPCKEGGHKNC